MPARPRGAGGAAAAPAAAALPELLVAGGRRAGARRAGGRRDGDHRVGRARRQEDRHVVADHASRARRVPRTSEPRRHATPVAADRSTPRCPTSRPLDKHRVRRPAARRRSGIRRSRSWSARSAAPSRRSASTRRPARSSSTISSKALRELPDEARGWQTETAHACSARAARRSSVFDPERVGQNCEFCGSPALVDYKEIKAPIRPQSLLPFKITRGAGARADPALVREQVARAGRAASAARSSTRARRLHPVLDLRRAGRLPVDGRGGPLLLHDRDLSRQQGDTQTRQVRHVRWEPASGDVEHFFDDEPVPGTQGVVARPAASRSSRFRRSELVPYDTAFLSGLRRRALPGRAARRGAARREQR